jgi:phospholipid/cholesterol/gamma-HCH transport system permease protein
MAIGLGRRRGSARADGAPPWTLAFDRAAGDTLVVRLAGRWGLADGLPPVTDVEAAARAGPPVRRLAFDAAAVTAWDTGLLTFVRPLQAWGAAAGVEVDPSGLPEGARRLLTLAATVAARKTSAPAAPPPWLARIGTAALAGWQATAAFLGFLGEAARAFGAMLRGRARFQGGDLALIIQEVGVRALPITTLIGVLIGLIFAFVGAIQLRQFGAQIYVADLVGIAVAQEVGALITAIVLAGRTGAAYAAQLGTMQVNEEIDALTTMGIAPMQFLVLPRILALVLMTPLLTIYADLLGIVGGGLVGVLVLDIGPTAYALRTVEALRVSYFVMGLVKASVFGLLIAIAGCLRGLQCRRSAEAVGLATTSAVVTSIVMIIIADGLLTVIYNALGL